MIPSVARLEATTTPAPTIDAVSTVRRTRLLTSRNVKSEVAGVNPVTAAGSPSFSKVTVIDSPLSRLTASPAESFTVNVKRA